MKQKRKRLDTKPNEPEQLRSSRNRTEVLTGSTSCSWLTYCRSVEIFKRPIVLKILLDH